MSAAATGLLTSLPVLAFAVFGALAPRLARLVGLHRLTLTALLCVVGGLAGRAVVTSVPVFLLLSLLALAGMATANVLLPSLVKLHFPDRVGLMTSIYSTALAIGLTSASVLTVPISEAGDGWRSGLLVWSFTAGIAALPWLLLVVHDRKPEEVKGRVGLLDVARTRLGWMMAAVLRPAVAPGLLDLRLVRRALPRRRLLGPHGRTAARGDHRREHPAVVRDPGTRGPLDEPEPADVCRDGLLPDRLHRSDRRSALGGARVGRAGRRRHHDLPADPDADRAACAHVRWDGRVVGLHPVHRVPDRRDRTVRASACCTTGPAAGRCR